MVVDEFSLMSEIVWTEYLEATLIDRDGWVFFIGVPKGKNWASTLWHEAAGRPGWGQWHFTTYDNPFMPTARIDDIKANSTERMFQQEYLAVVLADGGAVFRFIDKRVQVPPTEPGTVVFGMDWGRSHDWTVIVALDASTGHMLEMDRFNQISWSAQRARVETMAARWNPDAILAEENSIGQPNIEELQKAGLPVEGFNTTNASKKLIIDGLALAFEQGSIGILNDPVLKGELQIFQETRLPSGRYQYSAPDGAHDDTVMALALALHASETSGSVGTGVW